MRPQFIKVGSLVRYRPEDLESWLASLPTGGAQLVKAETGAFGAQRYRGTVKVSHHNACERPAMSVFKRGKVWWYEFWFAGRRIQESTKATSKTVARLAEQKRRRELEEGFNSIEDRRDERVRTIKEIAKDYLEGYLLRNGQAEDPASGLGPAFDRSDRVGDSVYLIYWLRDAQCR
jgi:hypothetical protein